MRGLRIPGLTSALFWSARRAVPAAGVFAAAFWSAGLLIERLDPPRQEPEAPVAFQSTTEQVQRSLKDGRLALAPGAVTVPGPPGAQAPAPPPRAADGGARPPARQSKALARFHRALQALETGQRQEPITILHLGDSHIASDRFTGDLRRLFQQRFGDSGRGMVMPGFPFRYYRARGVRFAKRGIWRAANSFKGEGGRYGLTGVRVETTQKNARLSLTSETGPFEWAEVTFLTGPKMGTAVVAVDGNGKAVQLRTRSTGVRRMRIDHKGIELSVRATGSGAIKILSWAVGHHRPGIRYVNLGIPGATADTPRRWDDAIVKADIENLDPDLIILGFGTNEGFNDGLQIEAYEDRVARLSERLLSAVPNASLAIIGPADGARLPRFARNRKTAKCRPLDASERTEYRELLRAGNGKLARWHPPPKLAAVRDALRKVAGQRAAHFWDWSAFMGGPCGVHEWARREPALASSDHVHITRAGSRRSAEAFFASLMEGYPAHARVASRDALGGERVSVSR